MHLKIKHNFNFILVVALFASINYAEAAKVSVAPLLIDLEMLPREVATRDILLTNQTDSKLIVYATVNEVALGTTGEIKEFISPSMTDQSVTVTSWTEISRGRIELEPFSTTTIPLTIRINPHAKAGVYTEFIGFVPEANRPAAEAIAMRGDADGVMVKIAVNQKNTNLLKITSLSTKRFIYREEDKKLNIEVENSGDSEAVPSGEVIFYSSRGDEVASVRVNEAGESIASKTKQTFVVDIPLDNKLGRFKANVNLEYGNGPQKSTLFDTTQFFMLPLILLLFLIGFIVILSLFITRQLHKVINQNKIFVGSDEKDLPLYVRNDRDHETKDHDIHIQKN